MALDALQARWLGLADRIGLDRERRVYETLAARYSEPQRHYHTLTHVGECLQLFDAVHALARDPDAVELGLWFHDAVCDARARNGEERSAEFARQTLCAAGARRQLAEEVATLVRATDHSLDASAEGDAALVCDLDLASLAAEQARFEQNTDLIRREYVWLDDAEFRRICVAFFQTLLAREHIYRTPAMRVRFETRARANLERGVATLGTP